MRRLSHRCKGGCLTRLTFSLLVPALLAISSAPALAQPENLEDAAQDGSGIVWVASRTERDRLFTFDGKQWSDIAAPFAGDARAVPLRLTRMPDGSVDCVWRMSGDRIGVTRQSGTNSQLLGQCDYTTRGLRPGSPPLADSQNRLWITGAGPEVYRADPGGKVGLVYTIKQEQRLDASDPVSQLGKVVASEDGKGRVWVWSDSAGGDTTGAALRGVLLFDGTNVRQQEEFGGVNDPRFSFIARKDEKHMWLASIKEGLFAVDIDTFKAEPVPEPEPGAFQWVKTIFSSGEDLFVIAARTGDIFKDALWRQRGGKWSRLIDRVDDSSGSVSIFEIERSWLRVGNEIVLCTFLGSPWLIHGNAPPDRMDWQRGYAIREATKIFTLPAGGFFALGAHWDAIRFVSLAPQPPVSRAIEFTIVPHEWAVGAGTVWAVFLDDKDALAQWDGREWQRHPLPEGIPVWDFLGVFTDTRGRVWLLPDRSDGKVLFFDSHSGKWQTYPEVETAFETLKNDLPQFVGETPRFYAPVSSEDKQRLAFLSGSWVLAYFDGKVWRHWKRPEIEGRPGGVVIDPPCFDKDGRLCVTMNDAAWQLDAQSHWQELPRQAAPPRTSDRAPTPKGAIKDSPFWAGDNRGAYWLAWHGNLYKCAYGTSVKIFPDGEPSPFTDGGRIYAAWADKGGFRFFQMEMEKRVVLAPKGAPPRATLSVTNIAEDSVGVRMASDPPPLGFSWRLDGGDWQSTKNSSLTLDSLRSGTHTLTALAFNDDLEASEPAVATFDIKVDSAKRLADLIQKLNDPDFANREKAVDALARQGAQALPALKAARDKSGDDQRWWIDATIQETERALARANSSPAK